MGSSCLLNSMTTTTSVVDVPGRISSSDKDMIASVYELLGRTTGAANFVSTLRVVDNLVSRFLFQIGNPKDIDMSTMRNLSLKMSNARSLKFDLPRRAVVAECWRESHLEKRRQKGTKRKRDVTEVETIETLPEYMEDELASVPSTFASDVPVIRSIMMWIVNRPEDFCAFQFSLERNEIDEVFDVRLRNFDAFSLAFIKDLMSQFKTFVQDLVVDWGAQTLMLRVSR